MKQLIIDIATFIIWLACLGMCWFAGTIVFKFVFVGILILGIIVVVSKIEKKYFITW